jgi:hypothetical protein
MAFDDWKLKQQQIHGPGEDYTWASRDIDDDGVEDGLVLDAQGRFMGVNGYRVGQQSGWAKQQRWLDPQGQPGHNRYVYAMRKQSRAEDGSDKLADIRKWFQSTVIKKAFEVKYEKGSPGCKAPRSGATNFVIAGIVGSNIDNAYLSHNQDRIASEGKTPSEALAVFHRTRVYRDALMSKLVPVKNKIDRQDEEAEALVGGLVDNYVRLWIQSRQGE